jgi:hypothetical protein
LAKELEGNKTPESLRRIKEKPIWKRIWNFPIPNAAENFLWCACHNSLAIKENLLRQKVVNEPYFPICLREPETTMHALWGCPATSDVWGCSKVIFQKCKNARTDFVDLAERIFNKCNKEDSALFILRARQVWMRRNKWVHDGLFINPDTVLKEMTKFLNAFKEVREKPTNTRNVVSITPEIQ